VKVAEAAQAPEWQSVAADAEPVDRPDTHDLADALWI
jgi:hypothetical protein